MPDKHGPFQEKEFRQLLQKLNNQFDSHYLISEIPQILSQIHRSKFILRHDICGRLDIASRMAELENYLDIRGTFLFDPSSPEISLARQEVRDTIRFIGQKGHEIGLHLPGKSPEVLKEVLVLSRKMEKHLFSPVLSVSFSEYHRELPSGSFFISGKISASSRILMGWHISDKNSRLLSSIPRPSENRPMLQVIIHPEEWMRPLSPDK